MTWVIEQMSVGGSGRAVMVKDTIDIAGYPTRASSRALEQAEPAVQHAAVVEALLASGCAITGKTVLHELAYGTTGINHYAGTAENPRYPGRIPGGSSSGSAAVVAAGECDFSLGTDTGGSVRIPACCCGVFGFKPTFGRVDRRGVMPAQTSLDCVGPFAASLSMLIEAMQAIDPTLQPLPEVGEIRLGVVKVQASAGVQRALDAVLDASGLALGEVTLASMAAAYDAGMVMINRETWNACGHLLASGLVAPDVAGRLQAAGQTTDAALAAAEQVRESFTAEVDAALERFPVLALPTMPDYPLRLEEAADTRAVLGMTAFVRPFNLSGHPALTIPFEGEDGLPVGLQLIAAKGADELLLAVAGEFLRRLDSNLI
ncbi:amidase [Ectopseudomonas oleovorans]|uniref:Amidase n=1 Tax=Ectopseudomonas oleovorans TaxID=301 RepID=A0AA42TZE3_ECTOL|nr:amidase [Pseudomonas oleovorans]MDH1339303.1 amidase [Pseudomonas oleovorans]MDH1492559.1 amidase [Pseudomonas oleovorans]WGG21192.1 amidase [Pseudomonas oleovorans]